MDFRACRCSCSGGGRGRRARTAGNGTIEGRARRATRENAAHGRLRPAPVREPPAHAAAAGCAHRRPAGCCSSCGCREGVGQGGYLGCCIAGAHQLQARQGEASGHALICRCGSSSVSPRVCPAVGCGRCRVERRHASRTSIPVHFSIDFALERVSPCSRCPRSWRGIQRYPARLPFTFNSPPLPPPYFTSLTPVPQLTKTLHTPPLCRLHCVAPPAACLLLTWRLRPPCWRCCPAPLLFKPRR